ncbi:MAG: formylglycine-generating enzyme family protein [Planctomycetota bacterium]
MNRFHVLTLLGFVFLLCITLPQVSSAEQPSAKDFGLATEQPTEGPFVKVDAGYMVPYTLRVPGSDELVEMIPVPGGEFMLGSPEDELDRRDDEGPQIRVTVDPMWVGKEEVSWGLYKEYMKLYAVFKEFESAGTRPVTEDNRGDAITAPTELYDPTHTYEYGEEDDQPAVTMTQYSAQQFTKWLSKITGHQYRLPTEAEWEYAARAGSTTAYPWGDEGDDVDTFAWYFDNADAGQVPGAQKEPNAWGLFDMFGNVGELTVNAYTEDGYARFADQPGINAVDVVVWPTSFEPCVVRGGTWESDAEDLRSAARMPTNEEEWKDADPNLPLSPWWYTSDPARGVGFRLFRSYKPLSEEKLSKFWDTTSEDVLLDVKSRMDSGRGGMGVVDAELPKAIEAMKK